VLLGLAAASPTCIALATELSFLCAGRKGLFVRSGAIGLTLRRAYRVAERQIPWLSSVALAASLALALSGGLLTRAGCLALGGALTLGVHLKLYSQVARRFRDDSKCLDDASGAVADLARLQARWDVEMTTRASLHAAALVCIVASMVLG
jgi:hypothetical protein